MKFVLVDLDLVVFRCFGRFLGFLFDLLLLLLHFVGWDCFWWGNVLFMDVNLGIWMWGRLNLLILGFRNFISCVFGRSSSCFSFGFILLAPF